MTLIELRHKYGQLMTQANAIAVAGFTTENRSQFDAMIADGDALHADIQRMEKAEKFVAEQRATRLPRVQALRPAPRKHRKSRSVRS